jgi:hypothetical protein
MISCSRSASPPSCLPITGNRLQELPAALGDCVNLEEVLANDNQISAIPGALSLLTRLQIIGLDGNSISAVPTAVLRGCEALQTLKLHDNPITQRDLEATDGFEEFEKRRQRKFSKSIATGVLLGSRGTEEAADRVLRGGTETKAVAASSGKAQRKPAAAKVKAPGGKRDKEKKKGVTFKEGGETARV